MKTIRNLKRRSGFTLVELLIVIIIIGILAGAMMMLAGSGTDRAEATKIISDLRSLKAAALMFYADKGGDTAPTLAGLKDYMDRQVPAATGEAAGTGYGSVSPAVEGRWYVYYTKPGLAYSGIAKALAGSAKDSGLLPSTTSADLENLYEEDDMTVYMRAR